MNLKINNAFLLVSLSSLFLNGCFVGRVNHNNINIAKDTLKVMTYNIHHGNPPSRAKDSIIDLQSIANVINKVNPDLVALQEIDVNNRRAGIDLNEAKELGKLTGMYFHFTRAIYYRDGEYGDAVLSRFPILKSNDYSLPNGGNIREETRSVCMIKIKIHSNRKIYFASTHLGITKEVRLLQAHKLVDDIKELSLPLIIGGDFNATSNSELIKFLDNTLMRSCTSNCGNTVPSINAYRKIDYIMFHPSDRFKIINQEIIQAGYPSDHLPVVSTLVF